MQDIVVFIQHHYLLTAALGGVLMILIILEFFKQKQAANSLTPVQATQLINHNKAVVIDVRNSEAYQQGHIIGAVSLPVADIQKSKKIEKFKNQPLIVVCAGGNESARAAHQLMEQGFIVHLLSGGLRAWKDAGMPLVKG